MALHEDLRKQAEGARALQAAQPVLNEATVGTQLASISREKLALAHGERTFNGKDAEESER